MHISKRHYACSQAQYSSAAAHVQTQQEVNKQLMERKQEIEWQLMTALAGHSALAAGQEPAHDTLLTDHNFDLNSPTPTSQLLQAA